MKLKIGSRTYKTRHFKKAFLVGVYALVAITMVAGTSSGAFVGSN